MKKILKDFVKLIDKLPQWAKVVLSIPVLDIVWALYRIAKGVLKNDIVLTVIGVLWIFGDLVTWLFDMITTVMYGHPKLT
jgi:hypothetical protein